MQSTPPVPQVIPVPVTAPLVGGVTVKVWRWMVKVAPTVRAAVMVTEQAPAPEQAPLQALRL